MYPQTDTASTSCPANKSKQFWVGVQQGLPIFLGYMPLGLAFGVIAVNSGLTAWQVFLMSLLVFSGSGQYIAVGMLAVGAPVSAILITAALINSRYLLLCASLAPYLKKFPTWLVALLAHGVTDEVYAVGLSHFKKETPNTTYLFGLMLISHFSWVASTVTGASLGNVLGDVSVYGIDFALTAMFISLLIMQINDRLSLYVAILGGIIAIVVFAVFASKLNILLAALVAATVGVVIKQWSRK